MNVFFVEKSANRKTGPIPVTYQPSSTCPSSCPFKGAGCYPMYGPTAIYWRKLDAGQVGISWDSFLSRVSALPEGQLWRYGVAGDLPGTDTRINGKALRELTEANQGRKVICYTHKPLTKANLKRIRYANAAGFTINLSADSLEDADQKLKTRAGPVVMVMPEKRESWPAATPGGTKVVPCPAVTHNITCKDCKLCSMRDRKVVIGFPAHGSGKKHVERVFSK